MYYLFWISIAILLTSCTKDQIGGECLTHEQLTYGYGTPIFTVSFPSYEMPYFNPNNPDEIIFRYSDGSKPEFDLIKYNLRTKEREVIYQGFFTNRPRWGKNNWILLNIKDSLGFNIYKMRSSGQELTTLTTSGNCHFPEWDITSEKFVYELGFTTPTTYILSDSEGNLIDTLFTGIDFGSSWQHKELIATGTMDGLVVHNPFITNDYRRFKKEAIAQSLNGAEWLDEERVIWCHTTGIYITNIATEETWTIKETCNSDTYQLPTYAPGINKVIFQRMERIKDTDTSGRIILTLVMMNPDGTEEETVEMEE